MAERNADAVEMPIRMIGKSLGVHAAARGVRGGGLWCLMAAALLALAAMPASNAAEQIAYRVTLAPTGDEAIDSTLAGTSDLLSLRGSSSISPFALIVRARTDEDRLKTVLDSFGYYRSKVSIKIDGKPLEDPGLADALNALAQGRESTVDVRFDLGPLFRLRRIDIEGALPPAMRGALGLKVGAPAVASEVLAGGSRLLAALQEHGYAFAVVDPPIAYEDSLLPVLDVTFHVVAGARVNIGDIDFVGLQRVHESLVRRRIRLRTGNLYSTAAVERARRDLLDLGVFSGVSVQLGAAPDDRGDVPIHFELRERPRHAVSLNTAFSSDLGGSGGIGWTDRNLFGNAEQLTVAGTATDIGGSATTGVGYDTSVKLLKPDFGHREQSLQFAIGAVKQSLQAYGQRAVTTGVTLNRKLSEVWSANIGLTTANETITTNPNETISATADPTTTPGGGKHDYTLIAVPFGVAYDSTNLRSPLDDPLHGLRGSASIAPTRSIGRLNASFMITQVKLAGYLDLHSLGLGVAGRSVIAARGLIGLAQGAGELSLPPDQRFYGGGSGTIRGYRYQSVGPQFYLNGQPDGNPIGGTAIMAGGLEFRQRFGKHFGAAAFIDGGQVSASLKPLPNVFRVGAGAGIRYYTPIGPIRLDVAIPTKGYGPQADHYEIYIGLGQAF